MQEIILDSPPLPEDWAFVWDDIKTEDEILLSEEEIIQISACGMDCKYFLENFCWIERKETGEILPFVPYDYQWEILRLIQSGQNIVINKSRRVGVSWMVAAYVAWLVNFHEGINVLLLSKKEDDAKKLLRKVKFILNNLAYHDSKHLRRSTPASFLRGEIGVDNQQLFTILYRDDEGNQSTHSEVASLTMTTDAGRSEGATLIFWDECAFAKPDDEATWASIVPTTLRGGKYILASTPNMVGGVFWSLVRDGQAGISEGYIYKEVHWSEAGITHEQVLAVKQAMKMTDEMFLQEFELQFVQAGRSVFSKMHLDNCYKPLDENPELINMLLRYDENGGEYFNGIDSASGQYRKGRPPDYNAFVALTNNRIVACAYQDRKDIGDWAGKEMDVGDGRLEFIEGKTSKLHKEYPGIAYIEKTGIGQVTATNHRTPVGSRSVPKSADASSKQRIVTNLILAVEGHKIVVTDSTLYLQMHDYIRITGPGSFGPPSGGNDDLVMALAWAFDALTDHGGKDPPQLPPPSPPTRESAIGITPAKAIINVGRELSEEPARMADMISPIIDLPAPPFDMPEPSEDWYT